MGVPSLFIYLYKKYRQVTFLKEHQTIKSKLNINLYFDFNSLIHPVVQSTLLRCTGLSKDLLYAEMFNDIKNYTDLIILLIDQLKILKIYIVIDGVAPRAKMNQQRTRRFLSILNNSQEKRDIFDTNCISPNTEFMNELSNFLVQTYAGNPKVIISDSNQPGEAEHKILHIIKKDKEPVSHIIYGLDGDLIMLGLSAGKNIKLLRENSLHQVKDAKFLLYHISGLKKEILMEISELTEIQELVGRQVIKDFVYLNFFIGNDFIPNLKNFEIKRDGIEYILTIYSELLKKHNGNYALLDRYNNLNVKALLEFLNELNDILEIDNDTDDSLSKNYDNKICYSYIKSSLWIAKYYFHICPTNSWYYGYYYPPTITDLIKFLNESDNVSSKFDNSPPVHPDLQLLCILPKESKDILDIKYHYIFDKFNKYYPDPEDIEIDMNGHDQQHKAVVKTPFINITWVESDLIKTKVWNRCIANSDVINY